MSKPLSDWAKFYTRHLGIAIVPIEPGRKFPRTKDWGERTLTDPQFAEAFYKSNPDWNMGAALHGSQLCSLDIDCHESFKTICDAFNIDLDLLVQDHPTIQGKAPGMRVMFRVPAGMQLPYCKLNWRPETDPDGEKHKDLMAQARAAKEAGNLELEAELREQAKPFAMYTVFEFRSATDGSQKQDVLPPSIHPETGQPYIWLTKPNGPIPEPPAWLLTIWQEFDSKFRQQFLSACPWADIEQVYQKQTSTAKPTRVFSSDGGLVAVVNEYNRVTPIETELEAQGYKRVGKNRYLSPYSSTGLPGVTILPGSNKAWIHHASDPLCSDESKQPVGPFDLYCEYNEGGDFTRAAQAIAKAYNIRTNQPAQNQPAPAPAQAPAPAPAANVPTGQSQPAQAAQPAAQQVAIDIATPLPWTNAKGTPYKHIDNLKEIIGRLGAVVRYNVMRKEEEIVLPGQSFSTDNEANASLAYLNSMCSLFDFTPDRNREFLTYLADSNQYSPVVEWVTSKPWDGTHRFYDFCNTVQTAGDMALRDALIKRWMLSAIGAAFGEEGVNAQGILVFQGAQDLGKTSWLLSLVPEDVNNVTRMVTDGVFLKPDDKDSVKPAVSHWLVELGELDGTFRKADVAQLKSFVTRRTDTMRLPYAQKESTFARRTVFFGSVNPKEFLQDETGNRRYWTIEVTGLNSRHDFDMQQVWAEVLEMWKAGERHYLTQDEKDKLNTSNQNFEASDPIEERLLGAFNWSAPAGSWDYLRATDALLQAGVDRPTRADTTKAGVFIRKMNGDKSKRCGKHGRRLLMPPALIKTGGYY